MNIGLVYNWPGGKNSELDLIGRICLVLDKQGHTGIIIDPFGKLLDLSGEYVAPVEFVDESCLDFALNFHYSSSNFLDTYSYFTNWTPVEYLRRHPAIGIAIPFDQELTQTTCMQSHDFALYAGSREVESYYNAININNPVFEKRRERIDFYPTCQSMLDIQPVDLENPRIFYIGVNWERLTSTKEPDVRHGGMLEQLDTKDYVELYGVKQLKGVDIWEGFKSYKGELPFDNGESIIRVSNKCGISLVLSSKAHRNSGLVSTRLFQACAARTVIIADDNVFIKNNFGDAVITFEYDDNPDLNIQRITEAYNWIMNNQELAREKAEKAHKIFIEKFTLETQVKNLISSHKNWCLQQDVVDNHDEIIEVVWVLKNYSNVELQRFVNNLNNQENVEINATIILSETLEQKVSDYLNKHSKFKYTIHTEDKTHKITGFYVEKYADWDKKKGYICIYSESVEWMSRHLYWLLISLHEKTYFISQTGMCIKDKTWTRDFKIEDVQELINFHPVLCEGLQRLNFKNYCASSFLIKKALLNDAIMSVVANLNYIIWYPFIMSSYERTGKLPIFVPKISLKKLSCSDDNISLTEWVDKTGIAEDINFLSLSYFYSERERNNLSRLNVIEQEIDALEQRAKNNTKKEINALEQRTKNNARKLEIQIRKEINNSITYKFISEKIKASLKNKNTLLSRLVIFTLTTSGKLLGYK